MIERAHDRREALMEQLRQMEKHSLIRREASASRGHGSKDLATTTNSISSQTTLLLVAEPATNERRREGTRKEGKARIVSSRTNGELQSWTHACIISEFNKSCTRLESSMVEREPEVSSRIAHVDQNRKADNGPLQTDNKKQERAREGGKDHTLVI